MSQTLRHIVLLLAASTAVQAWTAHHAVTTAPDAVRYVALADEMEEAGWLATVRAESEHPLFPTLVYLTRQALRVARGDYAELDATSVMLASIVPLVLSMIPVYFLLCVLSSPRPAFIGGLFFAMLPRIAMLGPDGLSDSTHLLLAATGMWTIAEFLDRLPIGRHARIVRRRTTSATGQCTAAGLSLMVGGACLGLALAARAEALLVLPALLLCMAWMWFRPATRWAVPDGSVGLFAIVAGLVCTLGVYFVMIDATSPRAARQRLLGYGDGPTTKRAARGRNESLAATYKQALPDGTRMSFEQKDSSVSSRFSGFAPAARQYAVELSKMLQPIVGVLALLGTWLMQRQAVRPSQRFAVCLFGAITLGAVFHASHTGYLQGRHLILGVVVALAPAGWAAEALGNKLASAIGNRLRPALAGTKQPSSGLASWGVTAVALASLLPLALRPLHATRASHREAAVWLRQQSAEGALVLDSHGFTGLYSGISTKNYQSARRAFASPNLAFVVVEQGELALESPRSKTLRHLLTTSASEAHRFSSPTRDPRHDVIIFEWQPARFAELINPQTKIAGSDAMLERLRR
ncbi:MAG: hypothetical protein AB7O62_24070 [Pirellulales bacterium]